MPPRAAALALLLLATAPLARAGVPEEVEAAVSPFVCLSTHALLQGDVDGAVGLAPCGPERLAHASHCDGRVSVVLLPPVTGIPDVDRFEFQITIRTDGVDVPDAGVGTRCPDA